MPHTNATRVFNDHEFRSKLCEYADQSALVNLACTSRLAFNVAVPRMWKALESIQPLLMLLAPSVRLTKENTAMITPPEYNSTTFTRFKQYSSFVQKLTVTKGPWKPHTEGDFRLDSWSAMILEAQRAPLLPNLQELVFRGKFTYEDEIVLWMSALIPPSLEVLDICASDDSRIEMSPNNMVAIFTLLPQKCPRLREIAHKLDPHGYTNYTPEQSAVLQITLPRTIHNHLQNSHSLTCLAVPGGFIDSDTLAALSSLPNLYALEIDQARLCNEHVARTFKGCRLAAKSFPKLQLLRLFSFDPNNFLAVWKAAPLVSGLTTTYLKYGSSSQYATRSMYEEATLAPLLLVISTGSPRMKQITLDSRSMNLPLSIDSATSSWDFAKDLRLTYLKLHNLRVKPTFLNNVHRVWASLLVLDMPSQYLTLDHLTHLSRLPNLKRLCAASFKDILGPVPDILGPAHSPLHTINLMRMKSRVARIQIKSVQSVARFLLALWPKLQQVEYKKSLKISQPDLELLNLHIRVIHGVAQSKKNISDRYGSGAARSLLDQRLLCF